jgi:hypothetical protein
VVVKKTLRSKVDLNGNWSLPAALPFKLELNFFRFALSLMFEIKGCAGRDIYPLTGDLNFKWFSAFQTVSQSP